MLFDTQNLYFTSDFHFGHDKIITPKFDNRPFSNMNHMIESIVKNWNDKIQKEDIVFFLGDLVFGNTMQYKSVIDSLNGEIYFIMGNHDKFDSIQKLNKFKDIFSYGKEISVKDKDSNRGTQTIVLSHYPILTWNKCHYNSWHLHGHSHHSMSKNPEYSGYYSRKVVDVGCNGWDYTPISYLELKEIMSKKSTSTHH